MTDNKHPWVMLASIYITQYIGVAFVLSAAVAILREQGVALDKLALLNLAVLPMMAKILYAPFIDKYRFLFQGTYRSWLILAQALMALLLFVTGLIDFQTQFFLAFSILIFYVFFVGIQDVAVDGLSCKLFDNKTRKVASSIQFAGNLLGNIVGGGIILMLYPWLEWQGSLWLLAGLTSISLIQTALFKEPKKSETDAQSPKEARHFWKDTKGFIKKHQYWLMILVLYPMGATCGFALLSPLLVDSEWPLDDIGFAVKIYGSIIGLFAALLATPLITRLGKRKALMSVIFIQVFALALMIPLTLGMTAKPMVYLAITTHFISFPALLVISSTIMMDNAAPTQHKATFFTLQFTVASILGFVYSALSLAIAKHLGYSTVVIIGVIASSLIALLILFLLKKISQDSPRSDHQSNVISSIA